MDHRKRFDRWRSTLPSNTAYFVQQIIERVVPQFEANGFVWYSDFAGGDTTQIGANDIPLQRRRGAEWPTVQIIFDKRRRPSLGVDFAVLPAICKRWSGGQYVDIPHEKALVFEGPAYFSLCKSSHDTCNFGYRWFAISPRRYLEAEIERLLALLPELFGLFESGLPQGWLTQKFGRVAEHVLLVESRTEAFAP